MTEASTRGLRGGGRALASRPRFCQAIVRLRASLGKDADLPTQVLALSIPVAVLSLPVYATLYALRDEYLIAAFHLAALLAILFVRRFWDVARRPEMALHTLAACLFGVIALTIWCEGGLASTSLPWLLLVPNVFVIAGFPRGGLVWVGLVTVFMGVLLALAEAGYAFPQLAAPQPLYSRLTDVFFLMITVSGFTLLTLRARRQAVRQLQRRNAELASARDAAVEASRVKAQFLANMSHEIRTPMNGVVGSTELLAVTPLSPEQRQLVQTLKQSNDTLLALINDVLDFSKIETGSLALDQTQFDPRETIEYVGALLAPQAVAKKLELSCRVAADVPATLIGDSLRVRQILTNLCGNAIKFTMKGEVAVEVARIPEEMPGRVRLRCVVEDTGIGIPREQVERLFQPFTQLDGSTTRAYGGTGLGLTISNELVAMMNGRIDVQSQVGVGSRFSCVLEFLPGSGAQSWQLVRPGLRVALVEPHPRTRSILAEQFQTLGAEIINDIAATGEQAVRDALASDADAVFIAGSALAELTRLHDPERLRMVTDARRRLVVLAQAGGAGDGLIEVRGLRVLFKPVGLIAMSRTLTNMFDARGEEREQPPDPSPLGGGRVLVAEDNPVNQRVVTAMLEKLGHEATVAADGAAALDAWMTGGYDAVIMDVQMPVMDGYQATRLIRSREVELNRPRTPIIALTANALSGDREHCLAAGMDDYIAKPLTLSKLQQALVRALGVAETRGVL